jgi:hypothetical protein
MAITFRMGNKDLDPKRTVWYNVHRTGKIYVVEGEKLEIFPITVLAQALGRTTDTVKAWEKTCWCGAQIRTVECEDGLQRRVCRNKDCEHKQRILPRPIFDIVAGKQRRYYTAAQVINLHHLAHFKYEAKKGGNLPGRQFKIVQFSQDCHRVWKYYDRVVVDVNGRIEV